MKTFKQFINEGLTDMMTPKSDKEINDKLKTMSVQDIFDEIEYGNLTQDSISNEQWMSKMKDINKSSDEVNSVLSIFFEKKYMDGIRYVLSNYDNIKNWVVQHGILINIVNKDDIREILDFPIVKRIIEKNHKYIIEKYILELDIEDSFLEKIVDEKISDIVFENYKDNPKHFIGFNQDGIPILAHSTENDSLLIDTDILHEYIRKTYQMAYAFTDKILNKIFNEKYNLNIKKIHTIRNLFNDDEIIRSEYLEKYLSD